jgi:hypothetical protein
VLDVVLIRLEVLLRCCEARDGLPMPSPTTISVSARSMDMTLAGKRASCLSLGASDSLGTLPVARDMTERLEARLLRPPPLGGRFGSLPLSIRCMMPWRT